MIDSVFPLAEARAAHERLEAGEQFGKILCRSLTESRGHRSAVSPRYS